MYLMSWRQWRRYGTLPFRDLGTVHGLLNTIIRTCFFDRILYAELVVVFTHSEIIEVYCS